jgi:5-methylcytosine-specific restriction endonuclease McrA
VSTTPKLGVEETQATGRTKAEIAERSRLIRKRTPDLRKELFEKQNGLCDLCGHTIQDSILRGYLEAEATKS